VTLTFDLSRTKVYRLLRHLKGNYPHVSRVYLLDTTELKSWKKEKTDEKYLKVFCVVKEWLKNHSFIGTIKLYENYLFLKYN